jgi:hypothetical protein
MMCFDMHTAPTLFISEGQETGKIAPATENARKKTFKKPNQAILFTSNHKRMPHMPSNYI